MFINSDFSDLLRYFRDNGVRYLVIGGYAVIQHAEPRFTKDLNLWISTDPANAAETDFAEEGYFYQMGVPPVRVDILMGIPGIQFEDAWERRVVVDFGDLPVTFISRQDLIIAKLASGPPQDLIDAAILSQSDRD